jgi:hypothetical protein
VACALHAWNVLEKDALPLLLTYHGLDHEALSLDAIKLLVFLTLPPDSDAANVIDQKRKSRAALEAMVRFRATRGDVFAVLFSRLAGPLERHEDSKLRAREEDGKLVQLFVTLVRNLLLASQSPAGETRGEADAAKSARRLRASVVETFRDLRVFSWLAQMARDARKKPFRKTPRCSWRRSTCCSPRSRPRGSSRRSQRAMTRRRKSLKVTMNVQIDRILRRE